MDIALYMLYRKYEFYWYQKFVNRLSLLSSPYDPCHTKRGLQIFVVVISKEGLAGTSPARHSFGMTLQRLHRLYLIVSVIPKRIVGAPTCQSFSLIRKWQRSLGSFKCDAAHMMFPISRQFRRLLLLILLAEIGYRWWRNFNLLFHVFDDKTLNNRFLS